MNEKKEKSFWAKGVLVFYILFMVGMLTLVKATTTANLDLVNEDYYADSEQYQIVIEAQKRTALLKDKPLISTEKENIVISRPESLKDKTFHEGAVIYSPSSSKEDVSVNVKFDEHGNFRYPTDALRKGNWDVNLVWQDSKGNKYMISQRLNL